MACAALVFVVVASSAWLRLAATPCPAAGCEGFTLADAVRLAHRIAAMGVSVLALVIAALAWRPPARPGLRAAAIAVLVLVAVLAFVGRRSASGAPPAVVITNLLGGLALLAACTGIAAAARFARGRCALPCLAAATIHGLALATGGLLAALPSSEAAVGLAHRALSWTALFAWGLIAFSALPPRAARPAARLAAAFLAAQALLAVAAPGGPGVRWLHNVLAAAGLCAAVAAAFAYRAPSAAGRTLPAEAPARP
jgi:heme A synthase